MPSSTGDLTLNEKSDGQGLTGSWPSALASAAPKRSASSPVSVVVPGGSGYGSRAGSGPATEYCQHQLLSYVNKPLTHNA